MTVSIQIIAGSFVYLGILRVFILDKVEYK